VPHHQKDDGTGDYPSQSDQFLVDAGSNTKQQESLKLLDARRELRACEKAEHELAVLRGDLPTTDSESGWIREVLDGVNPLYLPSGPERILLSCKSIGIGCMNNNTISNQRCLPDPEICQTRFLGQPFDFCKCLVENPEACEHAVVGYNPSVICWHPDRRSFEKTESSVEFNHSQVNHLNNGGRR
jgi:hypothetical protein